MARRTDLAAPVITFLLIGAVGGSLNLAGTLKKNACLLCYSLPFMICGSVSAVLGALAYSSCAVVLFIYTDWLVDVYRDAFDTMYVNDGSGTHAV